MLKTEIDALVQSLPSSANDVRLISVRITAGITGSLLALIGVAGFVPGATIRTQDLGWTDSAGGAELFGVYPVSVSVNLMHLLVGVAGVAAAVSSPVWVARYLVTAGLLFAARWTYQMAANPITTGLDWGQPQQWAPAVVGVLLLVLGIVAHLLIGMTPAADDPRQPTSPPGGRQ